MHRLKPRWVEGVFTLFVDNLPINMSNVWLKQVFKNDGEVVDTYVSRKSRKGMEGMFGFVRFKKEEEANEAIRRNNNLVIKGKKILVQMSKFARKKETFEGEKRGLCDGHIKEQTMQGPLQTCTMRSFANVVSNRYGNSPVGLERGMDGEENRLPKGVCLKENTFLSEWVNQLVLRNCIEEKIVVTIGDKKVFVHGVMLNSDHIKSTKVDTVAKRNNEGVVKEMVDDPVIGVNTMDNMQNGSGVRGSDKWVKILFPEINDSSWGVNNYVKTYSECLESNCTKNRVPKGGVQCEPETDGEKTDISSMNPTSVSAVRVTKISSESVHEYSGPWAPGYFKGPRSMTKSVLNMINVEGDHEAGDEGRRAPSIKLSSEKKCEDSSQWSSVGPNSSVQNRGSNAEDHNNNGDDEVEANLEGEGEGYSIGSDPSLPPGFASTIPFEVVKAAKINKRKENKMTSGKLKVKNVKDGPISVTGAKKKNSKSSNHNPITTKAVMDFAQIMGLDIEGKETETQHQIAKILQEEKLEWEKFQVEKRGETSMV